MRFRINRALIVRVRERFAQSTATITDKIGEECAALSVSASRRIRNLKGTPVPTAERFAPVLSPFQLFGRLLLAGFKITGYCVACRAQSAWYLAHGKSEMVGNAIGSLGRDSTNAIAEIFRH